MPSVGTELTGSVQPGVCAPGARVRVTVPASSANLGPGFDAFALALGRYDEVVAEVVPSGLHVQTLGEGAAEVPDDETHLVVRALLAALHVLGVPRPGLRVRCTNAIPHGRGLGSSAAAIVSGLLAGRALVPDGPARLDDTALLAMAAVLEGHPDNVAACLLGGFTIAWTDGSDPPPACAVRLEPAAGLRPVVFVPATPVATTHARGLLPGTVPHADAAHAAGRAGLLVEAITRRPDLLLAATEDRLHQAYRAAAMPESADLLAELRDAGVPAVISGAGPTVLALPSEPAAASVAARAPAGFDVLALKIAREGARVIVSAGPG